MSLGYAEKLSYREDVGAVGQKEHLDSPEIVLSKCKELAELLKASKRTIIMTGAGISTSIGIPDFRGPNGVWTCQKHGRPLPKLNTTFVSACPSLTHMAIVRLLQDGPACYVVSQNVDGLHRRSGISEELLAEVHGNCFMERCPNCGTYYMRDFEMTSVGFQPTGRKCTKGRCRGLLKDQVLDWEDALPEEQLEKAEDIANSADLCLCLGTSLQIRPICNLPLNTKRAGGKVAIVNLQRTPKHKHADVAIFARCDDVLRTVLGLLGTAVPRYRRWDRFLLRCWRAQLPAKRGAPKERPQEELVVVLSSSHGMACPLPMLDKVSWTFSTQHTECASSPGKSASCGAAKRLKRDPDAAASAASSWEDAAAAAASGEACVNGGEGPVLMTAEIAAAGDRGEAGVMHLQLELQLSSGADAALRVHRMGLEIAVGCLKSIRAAPRLEAMWATGEEAMLELLSQERQWSGHLEDNGKQAVEDGADQNDVVRGRTAAASGGALRLLSHYTAPLPPTEQSTGATTASAGEGTVPEASKRSAAL